MLSQPRMPANPLGSTPQRRLLTIVFCDLVGSTELSAGLDPEDLLDVMTSYHRCCVDVIKGAGGFVARMLGDAVVAYFGYPRAQEDDAIQAARAALDLFDAVAAVDTGLDRKLRVRIGIATGTVIVGDLFGAISGEQDVIGETANLAARLQTAAEPSQVIICSTTHDLARGHFRYRRLDPMVLKGFAEPVLAWQVLGPAPVASRFEAQHSRALTPLVGRKAEVDRLWRSWREACAEEGRVVLLTGEPGIGKSRLAEELIERLEGERYTLLRCFCSPYHSSSALFPLINQLERAAGFERADRPQRKLEKLESVLARSAAETEHRVAVLADLLSLSTEDHSLPVESPRERRERVFVVLLEQLVGLAQRRPVLMILEDLHWIDPTSQELLARLVELVPQSRVLVLLTARPEYSPAWRDGPHVRTIPLWGLDRDDAALVIAGVAGGRSLPAEVVEPILGRTEGVPLFLEELTKTMLESGLLRADDERYVLTGPLPPLAIPTSLEASLLARLDRLAPGMEVAQAGAALGRQFSYALIRSVSTQPDTALQGALAQLVDAQIIQQRGLPPDAEYRFNHALVQDVAYGMMMRGTRQRLHAQIVQALETDFPDAAEMEPEVVALHCVGADLIDKAVGYWLKAGTRAVTRSANREAIDHLTKGIGLLPRISDSPERARTELTMQLTLGHASIAVNGYCNEVTSRAYARAGELIEFGDLDQRVGILFGVYFGHLMGGKLERGIEPLQKLFVLAQENGHTGYTCLAHRVLGVLALYRGELQAARTHLETAGEIYDHAQHAALAFRFGSHVGISAQAWLSVALWLLGQPDTARRLADDAVAAARRFGHAHTLGHVLGLVTLVYAESEDFATLAAISAEGEEFCDRHRLGFFGAWLRFMHLWAGAHDGNRGESIAATRDALARYEATNTTLMRAYFRGLLVRSLLTAGRLDEAAAEVEVALRDIAETGEYWWQPEIHRLRAECLIALPNADKGAAESCLWRAIADARAGGSKMLELRIAERLARLLRAEGRESEVAALLTPILAGFTEGFATPDLAAAREVLAARPVAE